MKTELSERDWPASLLPKDHYQSAFQFSDVALSLLDPELTILDVNERQCRLLGRPRNGCLGIKFGDLFTPATADHSLELRQALRQSNPVTLEAGIIARDGVELAVSISARQIDTANGKRILASLHPLDERTGREQPIEGITKADEELIVEIARRKQAEESLVESEQRFRMMADTAPVMIWQAGTDKLCSYFNRPWLDFTGRTIDEERGDGWVEGVHPDDFKRCIETYSTAFEAQRDFSMEYRLRRYDGEYRWILDTGVPIFSPGGGFNGYIGSCIDITERKRSEMTLRESQRQLASTIGSAMDAIVTVDSDQRVILFNTAAEEMFGCPADVAIGQSLEHFIPERFRAAHLKHIRTFEETNTTSRSMGSLGSISGLRTNGEEFPIEASISQAVVGGKKLFTVIIRDITKRKQAENELKRQARLLDQATDAILVRDLEDRILFWSKGAEQIYGWSSEEAVGKHIKDLHYREIDEDFYEAKQILLERGNWLGETHHVTKDGKNLVIENRWTLLRDGEGNPESVLVINTDITEKKKLEAQFLRAQRMESIGTLAGGIAHDINNILSPILMSTRILQMKFPDEDSQRVLGMLKANAERGGNMVRQILGFARGVEGERILLQPAHLIREILKVVSETLPRTIEIKSLIAEDPLPIRADPTQFHQVLMNLIINARDAMPDGGRIEVEASNVQIDENYARMNLDASPGHYVLVTITDTGTGIPSEIIDKVFDPFFTTKELGKGTGLGLSTVMTIVKNHGGFITVYSEEGKGTEFRVYLPAAESSAVKQAEQISPELPTGHGELVLVVDDESTVREITKSTLESYGYRALTAADGTEAVALFAQHKDEVKVLLTDIMMPYMDGPATIRAIQRIDPKIRIIVSSGLKTNAEIVEPASAGGNVFLSKPYTADKLLNALAEVLAKE